MGGLGAKNKNKNIITYLLMYLVIIIGWAGFKKMGLPSFSLFFPYTSPPLSQFKPVSCSLHPFSLYPSHLLLFFSNGSRTPKIWGLPPSARSELSMIIVT